MLMLMKCNANVKAKQLGCYTIKPAPKRNYEDAYSKVL
jgi:hypothetical protein